MNERSSGHQIWKGSSGPLFLRSVWMDNKNYRHIILDNHKNSSQCKQQNCSNTIKGKPLRQSKSFTLEDELDNLHLVGSSEIGCPRMKNNEHGLVNNSNTFCRKHTKRLSFEILRRQIHENVNIKINKDKQITNYKSKSDLENSSLNNNKNVSEETNIKTSDGFNATAPNKTLKINETSKNQLTERVLNWLDLAGKTTLIRPETALPTIQFNNNESIDDIKKIIIPKRRILTTDSVINRKLLRKSESVHHLSLTLNDEDLELYSNRRFFEASSRCASAYKFGEFFPTSYRCSGKFLSSSPLSNSNRSINNGCNLGITFPSSNNNFPGYLKIPIEMESPNQRLQNKAKKYNYKKMDPAQLLHFEKEYKHIIHRQLLENSCNEQIAKRQLHIFMPNLPNKPKIINQDCESCLSTIVSEVSNNNKMNKNN